VGFLSSIHTLCSKQSSHQGRLSVRTAIPSLHTARHCFRMHSINNFCVRYYEILQWTPSAHCWWEVRFIANIRTGETVNVREGPVRCLVPYIYNFIPAHQLCSKAHGLAVRITYRWMFTLPTSSISDWRAWVRCSHWSQNDQADDSCIQERHRATSTLRLYAIAGCYCRVSITSIITALWIWLTLS